MKLKKFNKKLKNIIPIVVLCFLCLLIEIILIDVNNILFIGIPALSLIAGILVGKLVIRYYKNN